MFQMQSDTVEVRWPEFVPEGRMPHPQPLNVVGRTDEDRPFRVFLWEDQDMVLICVRHPQPCRVEAQASTERLMAVTPLKCPHCGG